MVAQLSKEIVDAGKFQWAKNPEHQDTLEHLEDHQFDCCCMLIYLKGSCFFFTFLAYLFFSIFCLVLLCSFFSSFFMLTFVNLTKYVAKSTKKVKPCHGCF